MNRAFEIQPRSATAIQTPPQEQWTETIPEAKDQSYALAETDAYTDLLRAALTKQAMDNTAVLAKFEEHYNSIAPCGKAEYRFIVQTYAKMAMDRIVKRSW